MVKIGELAKMTGCSVQTIRYYEKEQLLASTQRSEGNFRLYDATAFQTYLVMIIIRIEAQFNCESNIERTSRKPYNYSTIEAVCPL